MNRVLVIGKNWPEPESTAAGVRMMQLLQFFLQHSTQVYCATTASKNVHSVDLKILGIETRVIELNSDLFNRWVKELQPDVVVYDRFMVEEQFSWRVKEVAPRAFQILNTEDLHSLRETRRLALKQEIPFGPDLWRQQTITHREIGCLLRSDLNLLVSHFEQQWLKAELPDLAQSSLVLPFMYEELTDNGWRYDFSEREHFVFIGNGKHEPNKDAVNWLAKDLWPAIHKELPQAECHIYGSYWPSHTIQSFQKVKGLSFRGHCSDLNESLQKYRVNLLPLRYGAGIKGKLAEGMRAGCPSISTSQGVEGLTEPQGFPGFCGDKAEELIANAIDLYQSRLIWEEKQGLISNYFNANWSATKGHADLDQRLGQELHDLDQHRKKRLLQQTLWHHRLRSTEYLSRYIAEKNKNP